MNKKKQVNPNSTQMQEIGTFFQQMRNRKGISQAKLSKLIEVDPKTISRFENGETEIGYLTYLEICKALSIPMPQKMLDISNFSKDAKYDEWCSIYRHLPEKGLLVLKELAQMLIKKN